MSSGPKVTTKSMFVVNFNFEWITLAVKQISGITKKTYLGYKRIKYTNIHFASYICINSCSEMNIGETWSISLSSTWSKLSSTKKKQIVNIFGQKLIWWEVCFDKQLAFNGALLEVNNKIQQSFVAMSSLNVNRNLHKLVYTKLEKYSVEIGEVCSQLT